MWIKLKDPSLIRRFNKTEIDADPVLAKELIRRRLAVEKPMEKPLLEQKAVEKPLVDKMVKGARQAKSEDMSFSMDGSDGKLFPESVLKEK